MTLLAGLLVLWHSSDVHDNVSSKKVDTIVHNSYPRYVLWRNKSTGDTVTDGHFTE